MAFLFLGIILTLEWFIVENPEHGILFMFFWSFIVNCLFLVLGRGVWGFALLWSSVSTMDRTVPLYQEYEGAFVWCSVYTDSASIELYWNTPIRSVQPQIISPVSWKPYILLSCQTTNKFSFFFAVDGFVSLAMYMAALMNVGFRICKAITLADSSIVEELLKKISLTRRDHLIFTGKMINKGP